MTYLAIRETTNRIVKRGDILLDSHGVEWTYQSTTHPRKVFVTTKDDQNGPNSWPNMANREFYASVFNLGIWDTERDEWSFSPDWDGTDIADILTKRHQDSQTDNALIHAFSAKWNYDRSPQMFLDLVDLVKTVRDGKS